MSKPAKKPQTEKVKKTQEKPVKLWPIPEGRTTISALASQYGTDATNGILWSLINARNHLGTCRALEPDKPLLDALIDQAEPLGRGSVHWSIRTGFLEEAARAVLAGDSRFFKEVARLLERLESPPEHPIDGHVWEAYTILWMRYQRDPTKKQVKDLARYMWAVEFVTGRSAPGQSMQFYEKTECGFSLKPEIEKRVLAEMKRMPVQLWHTIFKRCNLSHLPSDKGGQPSHRQGSYYE